MKAALVAVLSAIAVLSFGGYQQDCWICNVLSYNQGLIDEERNLVVDWNGADLGQRTAIADRFCRVYPSLQVYPTLDPPPSDLIGAHSIMCHGRLA